MPNVRSLIATICCPAILAAQPTLAPDVRAFVSVDAPVVALTHARVIDGTGAPARSEQTIVIERGAIVAAGDAATVQVPNGARVVDLTGRTVLPGLVMVHEHMFYPSGAGTVYNEQAYSFPRLYLAGGVTTARTAGNMVGFADLELKRAIEEGRAVGPALDVTAPYLEGPGLPIYQVHALTGPDDARQTVAYWADRGATSFKAYMHITRAELKAAADEAHRRGLKITGHLCSITFREAAALGIDNLEHGLVVASDFAAGKGADACPANQQASIASVSDDSVQARVRDLVAKEMRFERDFFRAGGLLLAGTDPTGYGGVVAGYSNARELELLVEAGLTPLEAIMVGTLNGARYLGRADRIGSIAVGKRADLMVVRGDPSTRIADVENVETVFKDGVGFDAAKLFASVKGRVGLH